MSLNARCRYYKLKVPLFTNKCAFGHGASLLMPSNFSSIKSDVQIHPT